MTMSVDLGKFKTKLEYKNTLTMRSREVELNVQWHSCGIYEVSYYRPIGAEDHEIVGQGLAVEDWYPPNTQITFTPEQFKKVVELYPLAPKNKRDECYKPFYEDYDLSRGMFDFGDDTLFQAFKDPHDDIEKVYMVNRFFVYGSPATYTQVLGLHIEDFQRLKDLLNSKKDEIFYSGCRFVMP